MENTLTRSEQDLEEVILGGERFYKIANVDALRPFFMSIVSDANHWLFISSNGGLTAGRKNADYALFPYYTDDKITESSEITGSKTILKIKRGVEFIQWEPFSLRQDGQFNVTRNLYKHVYGNKVVFEEINHDLQLTYCYEWNSSVNFGFIRRSKLTNHSGKNIEIACLDGIQNILPYGVKSDLQNSSSNLVDAYKRNELEKNSGIGIYSLSAIIVDRAEPSEALKANIAWSLGFEQATLLVSSLQVDVFRNNDTVKPEYDVKAEKGAYFLVKDFSLPSGSAKQWMIVANVNQNHAAIAKLAKQIQNVPEIKAKVEQDIVDGTERLRKLIAAADGIQFTSDKRMDARHFSNVMFNIMRGGIFDHNYVIEKRDFLSYLEKANGTLFEKFKSPFENLPDEFPLNQLNKIAGKGDNASFSRLCLEYLPLKFSRRHGDPSRPWNKFSINTHNELDGSKILDYQGNWRDIFQNWEALLHSYPAFVEGMICKFLNATTFDGYNPYRVTKDGFDWETIEPDNPWSYIGYWGDHQIIYLLKFLEFAEDYAPGMLHKYFDQSVFVYANVPYRIKKYEDLLADPKDTIEFDDSLDRKIREECIEYGADAALLKYSGDSLYKVNFIEKILATVLAKLSNFIPGGGIWMNTQRPEWNDANNALVGNGVSMVTLCYLRRFLNYFQNLLDSSDSKTVLVSSELKEFFLAVRDTFRKNEDLLSGLISNRDRKAILDGLGYAASEYRTEIYQSSFSGAKASLSLDSLMDFLRLSLKYIDHTIQANRRKDALYHAYNIMEVVNDQEIAISHLSEMLEGQVAVLSSGLLQPKEVVHVLDALKNSKLYREDQNSYLLYPNKNLPGFLHKNSIPLDLAGKSALLMKLIQHDHKHIIERDINGELHFNGNFRNADDLNEALDKLTDPQYSSLLSVEKELILEIFEEIFNHKAFTGRSGTFFGYEGLGSIYWHMVSKLRLAVWECSREAHLNKADYEYQRRIEAHYYDIREGIGVHKTPKEYGAFPTDPYSHTPAGKGAQQPGMTGQVKEDILSRIGELGVFIKQGCIGFDPFLLQQSEFIEIPHDFEYVDVNSENKSISLSTGSMAFTYCQVPIVYQLARFNQIEVFNEKGKFRVFESLQLDRDTSNEIFNRTGTIEKIIISIDPNKLNTNA